MYIVFIFYFVYFQEQKKENKTEKQRLDGEENFPGRRQNAQSTKPKVLAFIFVK